MRLSEFFKEYSIDTIVAKTKISKETLQKLVNEDWAQFKKVQALGFLKIIEREFNVDLSEAKQSCIAYFNEHQPKSSASTKIIDLVDAQQAPKQGNFLVSFLLTILTFIALAYALWYFLKGHKQNIVVENNNSNVTKGTKKESLFQSSIEIAKEAVQKVQQEKKETNKTTLVIKQNNNIAPTKKNGNATNNTNNHQKFNIVVETNESIKQNSNTTQNEKNITKDALQETQSSLKETNETNNSNINETNQTFALDKNESEINVTSKNTQAKEQAQEENQTQIENNGSLQNSNSLQDEVQKVVIDSIIITPKSKSLWIGIYDVKTHKKLSKIIKKPFSYEKGEGALAIVTGHGLFSLKVGEIEKNPNSKKKQFIIIDENGITFVTKQEYRKITKKRAW